MAETNDVCECMSIDYYIRCPLVGGLGLTGKHGIHYLDVSGEQRPAYLGHSP